VEHVLSPDRQVQAFQFMFSKNLDKEMYPYIGVNPEAIFMENAADFLNMSVAYFDFEFINVTSLEYLLSHADTEYDFIPIGTAIMVKALSLHTHWLEVPSSKYKVIFRPEGLLGCPCLSVCPSQRSIM